MKYTVKGFGDIALTDRHFIAKGGEGSIYAKGKMAYKIYEHMGNMIPEAKIKELAVLDHPQIIKPIAVILDKHNQPAGYTMQFVKDTTPLARLFTKTFKQKNSITTEASLKLVKALEAIVQYVHSKRILLVDVNEMNFLANKSMSDFFAIDVNSYQTRNFPATAIMNSVRDYHTQGFTEDSDWFSWGIITFQLLTGIHPYKGNHPDFAALPMADRLEARMKQNVSVFDPKTTVPKVVLPFELAIPPNLRGWYKGVFEDAHRGPPPDDYESTVQFMAKIRKVTGGNLFEISHLEDCNGEIVDVFCAGPARVVQTARGLSYKKQLFPFPDAKVGFTARMGCPVAAYLEGNDLKLHDLDTDTELSINMHADGLLAVDGRLYARTGMNVVELAFAEVGRRVIPSVKTVAHVMPSSKVFDGVIIQNVLGRYVASVFPATGKHCQVSIPELDDYRVVDAKYQNKVLVVVCVSKSGEYDRFTIRFSADHVKYDLRKTEHITYTGINFVVADHGICVLLNEEEKLEAFPNVRNASHVKILDDPCVGADMNLFNDASTILFARGKELYSIGMK